MTDIEKGEHQPTTPGNAITHHASRITHHVSRVNRRDIADGLVKLGVAPGDLLAVHTSLSSFGRVDGGPSAVINALIDAVGPEGTALFPASTWRTCYLRDPAPPWPIWLQAYDPAVTPCDRDMGRVPEAARIDPRVRRSPHPLMSVLAIGALAESLTSDHPMEDPLRPYRRLAAAGGKVLLLGVDHTRNTTVHAAEFIMRLPHLSGPAYALIADPTAPGGTRIDTMSSEPDCSLGFGVLDDLVPRREQRIGDTIAWLCSGQALIDTALSLLRDDPGALLCDHPGCRTCSRGRALYHKPAAGEKARR